jgi:hypothetical protein
VSAGWGWVDFSTNDRNRISAIMSLLREQGILDELGIGVLRDAISDQLFPGLSTIQTRAKYFLFTPVIVRKYFHGEKEEPLPKYFARLEEEFLESMAAAYRKNRDETGIFAVTLKHARDLQTRPSSIYWNGQLTLGIMDLGGKRPGLGQYLAANSQRIENQAKIAEDDKNAGLQDKTGIFMPKALLDSFRANSIALNKIEAKYLKETFTRTLNQKYPDSLLYHSMIDSELTAAMQSEVSDFHEFYAEYFGPKRSIVREMGSARMRDLVRLGFNFSHAIYGALILYNILIQEKIGNEGALDEFWKEWLAEVNEATLPLDLELLKQIAPEGKAMTFLTRWLVAVKEGNEKAMRELVVDQEFASKTGRARLKKPSLNPEEFEDWIGMGFQNYRLRQAQTLIRDIEAGLQNARN